jgi:hypothetical protein
MVLDLVRKPSNCVNAILKIIYFNLDYFRLKFCRLYSDFRNWIVIYKYN